MQKNPDTRGLVFPLLSGFLFVFDQILKAIARAHPDTAFSWRNLLGWEYFENPGIAFSLPFPNLLLVIGTPIVLILLLIALQKQPKESLLSLGLLLIIFGALSNWIDRLAFAATIDYLRVWTGVINLADVMIVCGAVLLVYNGKQNTRLKNI